MIDSNLKIMCIFFVDSDLRNREKNKVFYIYLPPN